MSKQSGVRISNVCLNGISLAIGAALTVCVSACVCLCIGTRDV